MDILRKNEELAKLQEVRDLLAADDPEKAVLEYVNRFYTEEELDRRVEVEAKYAYDDGYNDAEADLVEDARAEGYDEGYDEGHEEGYREGEDIGKSDGYTEGYEAGYEAASETHGARGG